MKPSKSESSDLEKALALLNRAVRKALTEGGTKDLDELETALGKAVEEHTASIKTRRYNIEEYDPMDLTSVPSMLTRRLKMLRVEAGWSQPELAAEMAALGYDWKRSTVTDAEMGRRSITIDELFGLAICFEVPIGKWLTPLPSEVIERHGATHNYFLNETMVAELVAGPGGETIDPQGDWELCNFLRNEATAESEEDEPAL